MILAYPSFRMLQPKSRSRFLGSGKANKILMAEAFHDKEGFWLHEDLNCAIDKSPATDLVDSYAVVCHHIQTKGDR